ncbi:MAG: hypothetical protein H7Y07_02710 [Pyrinomonadaceae bacterium]|nr:hypothetical protein [Sphingobacteriaceae bacterium]
MISIIICSKDPILLKTVSKNIGDTIGVPFEIIAIENQDGKYGICKAYNIGAAKSKFDILCFAHEDISFVTEGWGRNVINHLQDKSVGLIGVAGADPKSMVPSSFAQHILRKEAHIISHSNDKSNPPVYMLETQTPNDDSLIKQVTGVDGVWMCTRRDVYSKHKFDDVVITGFHAYDIDYSLQVLTEYKVCVVFDVLLHHYSSGNFDRKYLDQKLILNRKWKKRLPISFRSYTKQELIKQHWLAMDCFINKLIELDYGFQFIIKQHLEFSFNSFFRVKPFLSLFKKIIVKKLA